MKALIVDDEPIARDVIRQELTEFPGISVVGEAENGLDALAKIQDLAPDLVFLDLQMPYMGGFEVIRNLSGPKVPVVVIVTAYDQHAIEAFEAGAVDYLLKPVSAARLERAIDRARKLRGTERGAVEQAAKINDAADRLAPTARKIVGRLGQEYLLLDTSEVLAFQADGEIVWIITAKQKLIATQSLRAIEEKLQSLPFHRIHRNAIVNVNHIRKMAALSSQRWLVTMSNGQEFIVSKRMAHNVRHMLQW